MKVLIKPSEKIKGKIVAPPSKSLTHRAIICASLANDISVINNILICNDTQRTIEACRAFGVAITQKKDQLTIVGSNGRLKVPKEKIDVGDSGTTFRFITALARLIFGKTEITGETRLLHRPMKELNQVLTKVNSGLITISGRKSSQFISALLLIGAYLNEGLEIKITDNLVSRQYVDLTIEVIKTFGVDVIETKTGYVIAGGRHYESINYTVEGDYSSASYFFAAAAIAVGSVTVANLNPRSSQSDRYFLDILDKMGAEVKIRSDRVTVSGPKALQSITVDMNDCPDIVPTLAIVASVANGETLIKNIGHLRHKESDRIKNVAMELSKMGIEVEEGNDFLKISGGKLRGAQLDSHNDHRIAMSLAIAALAAEGQSIINDAQVVNKSYPYFFTDLEKIGAEIIIK